MITVVFYVRLTILAITKSQANNGLFIKGFEDFEESKSPIGRSRNQNLVRFVDFVVFVKGHKNKSNNVPCKSEDEVESVKIGISRSHCSCVLMENALG